MHTYADAVCGRHDFITWVNRREKYSKHYVYLETTRVSLEIRKNVYNKIAVNLFEIPWDIPLVLSEFFDVKITTKSADNVRTSD